MNDQDDEGNAKELNFGAEFSDNEVQFLMNDEVALLLDIGRNKTEEAGGQTNETFNLTYQYTSKITTTNDADILRSTAQELRNGLASLELEDDKSGEFTKLHPFEVAQLANLMLESGTIDEALAWLPSLDRFQEASLQQALDIVSRARKTTTA
mmetsp:Transcript_21633/g.36398  ORF Transcript_21633/g.36398 Transcript_21633/m.36398 type:complete len:153 (-) Transcript_21633:168-626(-)